MVNLKAPIAIVIGVVILSTIATTGGELDEAFAVLSEEVDAYEETADGTEAALTTPDDISDSEELTVTFYNDGELALDEDEGDPTDSEYTESIQDLDGDDGIVFDHAGGLDQVEVDQVEVQPDNSSSTVEIEELEHHYDLADGDDSENLSNYPESQVFDDLEYVDEDGDEETASRFDDDEKTLINAMTLLLIGIGVLALWR